MNFLTHLECSRCGKTYDPDQLHTTCPDDGKPLLARYDIKKLAAAVTREEIATREPTLWRYREFLPVRNPKNIVTLGEGLTPLIRSERLAEEFKLKHLFIKDESQMPTGSFKARGLCTAISRAKELGVRRVALPSAGNAGGAAAAYAARAGMECFVFMPRDVPRANQVEVDVTGAKAFLVEGLITDAGALVREGAQQMGWFDLSTLKEPYRAEGKKTMGLELAEQLGWKLPDVILYPTGGGTGLVGMWKAFDELQRIGWIRGRKPRMVAVQSEGCAPIVRAFHEGSEFAKPWENASTLAAGIRVPAAVADFILLQILRESGGAAVTVSDEAIVQGVRLLARTTGIFAAPEGGATVAALTQLTKDGFITPRDRVVLFNTGSGLKYLEAFHVNLPMGSRQLWQGKET